MKKIISVATVLIALLYITLNYSEVESFYECDGEELRKSKSLQTKGYFRFSKYRWWVGLWSNSYGELSFETDTSYVHYGFIKETKTDFRLFDFVSKDKGLPKGHFSKLSNKLSLKIGNKEHTFNGICKERKST